MTQIELLDRARTLLEHGDTQAALQVITELRASIKDVQRDPLTGLQRREHLDRRQGGPTGVVFVDLDGLKWINDTQGHAAGDAYIARAAEALSKGLREGDTAMRWGGDEYVLVLPGVRDENALAMVALRVRMDLHEAGVSASVGTAVQHVGELLQSAIDRADAAMYLDKQQRHQGRNRDHTISMSR